MINHKVVQLSIYVGMSYLITKVIILFANERIFQNRRTFGEVTDKSIVSFF